LRYFRADDRLAAGTRRRRWAESRCAARPAGAVIVREDLSISRHSEVFVIGDLAHCLGEQGTPLPGLSPVAMQQGRHVAKNIRALAAGGWTSRFSYFDKGTMATIGRHAAVAMRDSYASPGCRRGWRALRPPDLFW